MTLSTWCLLGEAACEQRDQALHAVEDGDPRAVRDHRRPDLIGKRVQLRVAGALRRWAPGKLGRVRSAHAFEMEGAIQRVRSKRRPVRSKRLRLVGRTSTMRAPCAVSTTFAASLIDSVSWKETLRLPTLTALPVGLSDTVHPNLIAEANVLSADSKEQIDEYSTLVASAGSLVRMTANATRPRPKLKTFTRSTIALDHLPLPGLAGSEPD